MHETFVRKYYLEDLINSEGGERKAMKSSSLVLCSSLSLLGLLTFSLAIPISILKLGTARFSAETPNLGITSISSKKTIVGEFPSGPAYLSLGINVTNYGSSAETFNATFFANSTAISEILNVTVEAQNFTIVVFEGSVTGLPYGNYSISASITPVTNETELSDNFIDNFWIFITILGDINGDKWVDIYDALIISGDWLHPVHPCVYPWNPYPPEADLNNDGRIDIFDAILVASNFGKHWE